jgi:hypothetical protein
MSLLRNLVFPNNNDETREIGKKKFVTVMQSVSAQ